MSKIENTSVANLQAVAGIQESSEVLSNFQAVVIKVHATKVLGIKCCFRK